ncbi:MAG: hypothetical protein FJ379_14890 [Verrucomicrobia bacterium]|nr:hypothetical protein [Verrucomicrobiota bacterium]
MSARSPTPSARCAPGKLTVASGFVPAGNAVPARENDPLIWPGVFSLRLGDPITANLEAASKGDVEEVLKWFLRWFEARFATDYQTARNVSFALIETADHKDVQDPDCPAAVREDLRVAALEGLCEQRGAFRNKEGFPEVNSRKLGHFLKANRGRVIGGRRIQKSDADDRTGCSYWGVTSV